MSDVYTISDIDMYQGVNRMSERETEWIPTRDAMSLLNVTSTQGVWDVIKRAERKHKITVRTWNIGTENMPRYWLNREDVLRIAEVMGKS